MRLLLLLLLLLPLLAPTQTLRKDLKRDFGAIGDGRHDDQAAFHRAADFFNERAKTPAGAAPAVLYLPAGTYRVGTPGPGSMASLLALRGCRNLTIRGADSTRTVIRYADSLRYGTFNPATHQPYEPPVALFTDWNWGVSLNTAVDLQKCENVEVSDLALDGNSVHLLVGGHWGDTGIQCGADGLFVSDSRRVRVRRLAVHHFGRDGIQVLNHLAKSLDDPSQEDILLENSRFEYNGRQGLSITGANGLRAVNCSFSHTGRVVVPMLGKALFSNPGAGIDIEPEGGYVANVLLERCRLVDNAGQALDSDRYGDGPPTSAHIVVRDCLFWGTTNWSIWLRQPGFLFENCRLYGAFENGCRARGPGWATRFVGCTFEDRPYHGQPAYGPALLHSDREARGLRLENCRLVAHHANLLYAVPAPPLDTASRFELHGCTLVLDQAEPPLAGPEVLAGVVFSGTTTLAAGPQRPGSATTTLVLGAAGVARSAVLRPGARLLLLAPGSECQLPGGLELEPEAELEIGAGARVQVPGQAEGGPVPQLCIGAGARVQVRQGGGLLFGPAARLVLAGELLVEPGGQLAQPAAAEVQRVGRGVLIQK